MGAGTNGAAGGVANGALGGGAAAVVVVAVVGRNERGSLFTLGRLAATTRRRVPADSLVPRPKPFVVPNGAVLEAAPAVVGKVGSAK